MLVQNSIADGACKRAIVVVRTQTIAMAKNVAALGQEAVTPENFFTLVAFKPALHGVLSLHTKVSVAFLSYFPTVRSVS